MTRERLRPLAMQGWLFGMPPKDMTFEQYFNRVELWAIENPDTAEELVRQFENKGNSAKYKPF